MFATTCKRLLMLTAMAVFLVPVSLFAGNTGKITGTVKDKETGDVLPGVNIIVDGTTMGAATNSKGEFSILGVPAGVYTLSTSMIGYTKQSKQNVRVLPDFTTRLDFDLSPESLGGEEIVITAERPLIQRDQTMTMSVTSGDEIKNLPVRGFQAAANLGVGIVVNNTRNLDGGTGNVNVRGGRINETGVYIDGFQQNNLLTGVANASVPNNAVEEVVVITGGFDAEYGRNQSGIIQVTTKSGGQKYSGSLEYVNDRPMFALDKNHYYGYDVYSGGVGGPLIPGNNKIKFYVSAEGTDITDDEPSALGWPVVTLSPAGIRNANPAAADTAIFTLDGTEHIKYDKGARPKDAQGYGINSRRGYNAQAKISFDIIANTLRVDFAGNYGQTYRRSAVATRIFAPDGNLRRDIKNGNLGLTATYTLNPNSFLDAGVNYFFQDRRLMNDHLNWNLPAYHNRNLGGTGNVHYYGDNLANDINRGVLTFRRDKPSYIAFKADYVNQIDKHNQVKAGFDYFNHTVRFLNVRNVDDPVTGINDYVGFTVVDPANPTIKSVSSDDLNNKILGPGKPYSFSFYAQDKLEYEGLVLRGGIRYDLFNSGTKRVKNLADPTGQSDPDQIGLLNPATGKNQAGTLGAEDYTSAKNDNKISPRVSVSFPVSEKTQFRLSYGKFYQQPNLQDLYVGPVFLERMSVNGGIAATAANPNISAENTTQYEVGLRRILTDNVALDLSAFYKDISGLVQVLSTYSVPNNLYLLRNEDEGIVQGFTIGIEARRVGKVSGRVNYTLSSARGSGSGEQTGLNAAWLSFDQTKFNAPLSFDQRHTFNASMDIRNSKGQGPTLGGIKILEDAGINFVGSASSGLPYTPRQVVRYSITGVRGAKPVGRRNSENMPWTFRIDMKADKTIQLYKDYTVNVYVQVLNLLDRKNAITVWDATGRPSDDGFLDTVDGQNLNLRQKLEYQSQMRDGFAYDTPRQVRLGLLLNF